MLASSASHNPKTRRSAKDCYERAVSKSDCPGWAFLELAKNHRSEASKAQALLVRALENEPDYLAARLELARYYLRDEPQKCLEILDQAPQSVERDVVASWYAAQCHMALRHWDQALDCMQTVRSTTETGRQLLEIVRGDILFELGNLDEALAAYEITIDDRCSVDVRLIGLFSMAYALLRSDNGRASQILETATHLALSSSKAINTMNLRLDLENTNWGHYESDWYGVERALKIVCQGVVFFRGNTPAAVISGCAYVLGRLDEWEDEESDELNFRDELGVLARQHSKHAAIGCLSSSAFAKRGFFRRALEEYGNYREWAAVLGEKHQHSGAFRALAATCEKCSVQELPRLAADIVATAKSLGVEGKATLRLLHSQEMHQRLDEAGFHAANADTWAAIWSDACPPGEMFRYAYALQRAGRDSEAEPLYARLIAEDFPGTAHLSNLAIICEGRGDLIEAERLLRLATERKPKDQTLLQRLSSIAQRIAEETRAQRETQRREQEERAFLESAPSRWPTVDGYKRRVLAAYRSAPDGATPELMAKMSGVELKWFHGHVNKLIDMGMLLRVDGGLAVNSAIVNFLDREQQHAVVTQLVRLDDTIAYKAVFNSKLERSVYSQLTDLFPNHLVFPNMAPQAIFQYDRMKELLTGEEFTYFLRCQVDFCIVSTATYLPLVGLEVDSDFHDNVRQVQRDTRKDRIFQVGGVPLVRLRQFGRPTEGAVRAELVQTFRRVVLELRARNDAEARRVLDDLSFDEQLEGGLN
jgi:tetratricopeptide (TPR) repeat protein